MPLLSLDQQPEVCILLGTYNGESYIRKQLDSLLAQTYPNWKLLIRDDNSIDATKEIIAAFAARDPRIILVNEPPGNLGSCANFSQLLKIATGSYAYFMFCDQDDFWLADKVERSVNHLLSLEQSLGTAFPILVHTRFQYVDENLEIIETKRRFQATKVKQLRFQHLLAQNPVYGCTMIFNRALAEAVGTIPPVAENHNYWVALVAAAFGHIGYINRPTILYRQHSNNISTNHDDSTIKKRVHRNLREKRILIDVQDKFVMAAAFKEQYEDRLAPGNRVILRNFLAMANNAGALTIISNIKSGVRRQTFTSTCLFYIATLFVQRKGSPA